MNSSLKKYLLLIFLATILCLVALGLIIFNTNPYIGRGIVFLFFVSLFFSLVGVFTLIGFYLRLWFSKNEIIYFHLVPSIRQAILISMCFIVLLGLQDLRLINIWTASLLILAILSLEFFFRTKPEKVKKL